VRGGAARPPSFTIFTIAYKVAVYAPAERADTLPLSHIYPYHVLCGLVNRERDTNYHGIFPYLYQLTVQLEEGMKYTDAHYESVYAESS